MGRAPCCDKANVKKGPWSPEEDAKLKSYIEQQHGSCSNWIALPQKIGLKRCGKSCRLRWLNYLRPDIKHGGFSEEEDNLICNLYMSIGSRWSIIAAQLPRRTDNDIKNYWNTRLKKKLLGKQQRSAARKNFNQEPGNENEAKIIDSDVHYGINQHHQIAPYWPEPPAAPVLPVSIPYSNEEPSLADHSSIRKLLIKLEGRFSEGGGANTLGGLMNPQFPIGVLSAASEHELYSITGAEREFVHDHSQYMDHASSSHDLQILEGQSRSNYSEVYQNQVDGLEFLYEGEGEDNNRVCVRLGNATSGWSEMGSVVISPSAAAAPPSYEVAAGMLQEGGFNDGLRY